MKYPLSKKCFKERFIFVYDGIKNSVEDYNSSRMVSDVVSVPIFKHGIISKRFELEG